MPDRPGELGLDNQPEQRACQVLQSCWGYRYVVVAVIWGTFSSGSLTDSHFALPRISDSQRYGSRRESSAAGIVDDVSSPAVRPSNIFLAQQLTGLSWKVPSGWPASGRPLSGWEQ
jgi:hypothetical protein